MKKIAAILGLALCFACANDDDNTQTSFNGDVQWARTFGGSNEDIAYSVIETQDGNIAVLGYTNSTDGDLSNKTLEVNDYWFLKLDQEGNILLNKTYGGSGDDRGQKIIQTPDGGYAIVGYSMSSDGDGSNNEGFHDNWILKLDNSGNIIWEKSYGFSGHDHAYGLIATNDGGFFMTGFLDVTASGGEGNDTASRSTNRHGVGEFWCHKLDANGDLQWRRYFGGTNNDRSFSVVQANDGGYVIAGFSESTDFDITGNQGSYDYWVIKLDIEGNLVWQKTLGGSGIDQSRSIVRTNDNGYIIAGNSFSSDGDVDNNKGSSDFWLAKINDNGNVVWKKNYGGSDFDFASSIRKGQTGYIVSGYTKSLDGDLTNNKGDNDYWVIKINESGDLLWQKNYGGSGLDLAHDAIEMTDRSIILVGDTESLDGDIIENKGLKDALIVKVN
ncbi:hypothetical protein [Winogradskyella sp. 3972H.M.0a.05]|uniref:hypothetical protein n=1 Tax=Winogradskyella sp. 3972H.M.0a.05 TaxID=2950277 RepID=UPI0033966411